MNIKLEENCERLKREKLQKMKKRQDNILYFVLTFLFFSIIAWPFVSLLFEELGWYGG
ncbi:hypothetical protein ACQV2X_05430 [Facklamia sp. P12945]|uniref:hypothetical protein n=1 Tax=Facklamia sp. P12945 TaxID=3421950 RepID=UPI003D169C5E